MRSWKTTALGLITAATIILPQIQLLLDSNPDTVMDYNVVFGALGTLFLGLFARDNNVSSEKAGAK